MRVERSSWSDVLRDGLPSAADGALVSRVRIALSADAPPCTAHPLGFYHFRLDFEESTAIRLHYWPPFNRLAPTAITPYHDHVWDLQSAVLMGGLVNVFIEVVPDPEGQFHVASIRQDGRVDEVKLTDQRVRIESEKEQRFAAGERYEIGSRRFHRTDVEPGRTALTLVRSEVTVSDGPRTLVPVGSSEHAPARMFLESSEAQRVRRESLNGLQGVGVIP